MSDIHVDECTAALTSALACGVCDAAVSACVLDDSTTSAASGLPPQSAASAASAAPYAASDDTALHQRVAFASVLLDALGAITQRAAAQWPASHVLNPRYHAPSTRGIQPHFDALTPEVHARAQRQVDGMCALALTLCAPPLTGTAPARGSCGGSRSGSGLGLLPRLLFVLASAHDAPPGAYDRPAPSATCASWPDLLLRAEPTRVALISLVRACRYAASVQETQMQDTRMPSSMTVTGKRVRAR